MGFGLAAGAQHGVVPRGGAALGRALLEFGLRKIQWIGGLAILAALLGFEHEAAALVEVDPPGAGGSVAMMEDDVALEHIGVEARVGQGWIGRSHPKQGAQLGKEALAVGALRRAGVLPPLDKYANLLLFRHDYPALIGASDREIQRIVGGQKDRKTIPWIFW